MTDTTALAAWLRQQFDHTIDYEDHGYSVANEALRVLAVEYADRPGYREEWRP